VRLVNVHQQGTEFVSRDFERGPFASLDYLELFA
jgi:hypothetical protein